MPGGPLGTDLPKLAGELHIATPRGGQVLELGAIHFHQILEKAGAIGIGGGSYRLLEAEE